MMEKYRGFTIQENKIECTYKEVDGEKYFLPDVTAFDTVEEAKKVIDKVLEK